MEEDRECEWRARSGLPKKVPEDHYRCIDNAMAENDELTASDVKEVLVKTFGADKVQYSIRTIGRLRNDLGWTYTTAKYCQAIRDANKRKRLDWCNKRMEEKEDFHDAIFTDECSLSATGGSASERIRHRGSWSTSISTHQSPCMGWDIKARRHTAGHFWRNHDRNQVWRHTKSLSCSFCPGMLPWRSPSLPGQWSEAHQQIHSTVLWHEQDQLVEESSWKSGP